MPNQETQKIISLLTVCNGSAVERFDHELKKVLNNCLDPNYDPKAVRKVKLELKIQPDENREILSYTLTVKPELPGLSPVAAFALLGKDIHGNAEAREVKPPQQMTLPGNNVTPIKKHKEETTK